MERILGDLADTDETIAETIKSPKKVSSSTGKAKEKEKKVSVTPTATTTSAESAGTTTESSSADAPVIPFSLATGVRTRYIGDMSPLPFLAQKINFEDARIASRIGIKIRRFGQSLVLYEKDESLNGKTLEQSMLEDLNLIKPGETIKGLNDWIYKVAGVDKATSDSLMKIYFAYIHPGLPVVNKVLFLKQYRGEIGEYPSAPLLNAIYGAAVRYIETCELNGDKIMQHHHIKMKEGWSEGFFENLLTFIRGRYTPCIATVQALVIGQNHRASLDEKLASAWLLNSAAQDLGLHRSSDCWDIPASEKETRKRVWWSVYIMDKWSSASTGRPQTIFDEDCDEGYPSEIADWEEVMDVKTGESQDNGPRYPSLDKSVAQKAKNEKIPIYQPFVQLVKLSEILGRILQGLYTPLAKKHSEKHGSDAVVTYLDNALSEWRSALPPALQISTINVRRLDSHGRTPLLSMSGLMYLSYCTLLILLHRPFIEKEGQNTRSSKSSLSICTSAATRCVDIAEKMHYRDFLLVSWNFAIYPVFTAALIHIYNASNPDSIVSDEAKSNLIKATGVIKRLSKLSSGARRLYDVLRQLMRLREITVDNSELSDDTTVKENKRKTCHVRKNTASGSRLYLNRASSTEMNSPMLSDSEVASTHSTPSSIGNGEWINGLYSQLQTDTPFDAEPYSLRQFGINMNQMYTPMQTPAMPQQYQPNMQPQPNMTNMMLPTNPADSFLFGLTDLSFSTPYQPGMIDHTLFRNRPDNPFWSVPSSIELDDWTAYLLPQQPTSTSNTHPRDWNPGWA
ncbi:fungal-specific transcription factor domain-containing protein [Mucor mucedo]|uniref:fungal-specific transcription factor domain-containing protein n=1 Tax=Mucor mucedo TaxID=29922 RepID=UPI0022211D72|nr:fungal-specific transcription factor domain-containing protein [Mucor mucedo]KAI7873465.1 fungal-specific transcription factor domain-containing protein [Mucor mucedo]